MPNTSYIVFIDNKDLSLDLGITKLHLFIPESSSFAFKNPKADMERKFGHSAVLVPPFANSDACLSFPH